MTQTDLGAAVGVGKANVSAWETGRHEPSYRQILLIQQITRAPTLPHELDPPIQWPMPMISRERWEALDVVERAYVQGRTAAAIDEAERARRDAATAALLALGSGWVTR